MSSAGLMQRVVIDTDPGIDDAAAILFGLASGLLKVELLTCVFGNVEVEQSARNALVILELAGRQDIPVYVGADRPLLREPLFGKAVHGQDGLGDAGITPSGGSVHTGRAAERMLEAVMAAPGDVTVIALGPLTNVALALALEPEFARSVRRVVVMGGAVRTPGNISSVATANLFHDPEAASIVYASGVPIVQVGMEVCRPTVIGHGHLERLRAAGSAPTDFLMRISPHLMAYYEREYGHTDGVRYNDLVAISYLVAPKLFRWVRMPVLIETAGTLTRGQTVSDWHHRWAREANVDICLEVDSAGIANLFTETLLTAYPVTRVRQNQVKYHSSRETGDDICGDRFQ